MANTIGVISSCGATVQIMKLSEDDGSGGSFVLPQATSDDLGGIKLGAALTTGSDGKTTVVKADMNQPGIVTAAFPVADVEVVNVTDIQSAQAAIAAMGTTLAELMQSLRQAGVLLK